uniref:F-actin-capping protein subunit alpha n=1 Tax=Syphacia muris TaxID=451379 RepID=A0A0N5APY4_9BILA
MAANDTQITEAEKIRIASNFLLSAPPGEFNEVFNDVRMLLNDDTLLKEGCAAAFAEYNKEQFMPVKLEGVEKQTLITKYNERPGGKFFDPKSKNTFAYSHLRKEATDLQSESVEDKSTELWRKALQEEADKYIDSHYEGTGIAAIFVNDSTLTLCIESHRFQPKNFWNGRWRSQYVLPVGDGISGTQQLKGIIKVQVHYYEDGNVQLVSTKEVNAKVQISADYAQTAKEIFKVILLEESAYQDAVQENYQQMSNTTFKALRRQLPVTGAKFDWNNTHAYRIVVDLK